MPEGHTVHRLARDLAEMNGARVRATSPQGRFAAAAELIDGQRLEHTDAFGKHLFLRTGAAGTVHVHLGMQGKWFRYPDPTSQPLKQARLRLATDAVAWDLVAPSVCELVDDAAVRQVTSALGPDPLRPDADEAAAVAALAGDRRAIGAALLDQGVISGVGNVFRNEALHAIGVNPSRPSRALAADELHALWLVLRSMMSRAVDDGRIITVDAEDRLSLPESESRRVYKQERCRDCGAPVTVATVGGRTAYFCPVEQPR